MPETIDILEQQLRERPHYVTKGSYPNFGTSRYLNTPKSVPNTSRKKNKVNLPRIQHSASESRAFATTNLDYVLTPAPANYGTYNSETNSIESSSPLPSKPGSPVSPTFPLPGENPIPMYNPLPFSEKDTFCVTAQGNTSFLNPNKSVPSLIKTKYPSESYRDFQQQNRLCYEMYQLRKDHALKFLQFNRKLHLNDYSIVTRQRLLTNGLLHSPRDQISLSNITISSKGISEEEEVKEEKRIFQCFVCQKIFETDYKLRLHIIDHYRIATPDVDIYYPESEMVKKLNKIVEELERPIVQQVQDNWAFFELAYFPNPKLVGPKRRWKIRPKFDTNKRSNNNNNNNNDKDKKLEDGEIRVEYLISLLCSPILPKPFNEDNLEFTINRIGRYLDAAGETDIISFDTFLKCFGPAPPCSNQVKRTIDKLKNDMISVIEPNLTLFGTSNKAREDLIKEYLDDKAIDLQQMEKDIFIDSVVTIQSFFRLVKAKLIVKGMNDERKAYRQYKQNQRKFLRLVLTSWSRRAHYHQELLRRCHRHFASWKYYCKIQRQKRYLFRMCFWPMYIWRRYVRKMMKARAKAQFLKKIFETYIQIDMIRRYKRCVDNSVKLREIIVGHRRKMNKRLLRDCFKGWLAVILDKKRIVEMWKSKGLFLMRKQLSGRVRTPFSILAYYSYVRHYLNTKYVYQVTRYDCSSEESRVELKKPELPPIPSKYHRLSMTIVGFDVICKPMRDKMIESFEHNHILPMKHYYTHRFRTLLTYWKIGATEARKEKVCMIHGSLLVLKHGFEKWLTYHVNYKEKIRQIELLKKQLSDKYQVKFDAIESEFNEKARRVNSELEGTFALLTVCKIEYQQSSDYREGVEKELVNDLQNAELQARFIETQTAENQAKAALDDTQKAYEGLQKSLANVLEEKKKRINYYKDEMNRLLEEGIYRITELLEGKESAISDLRREQDNAERRARRILLGKRHEDRIEYFAQIKDQQHEEHIQRLQGPVTAAEARSFSQKIHNTVNSVINDHKFKTDSTTTLTNEWTNDAETLKKEQDAVSNEYKVNILSTAEDLNFKKGAVMVDVFYKIAQDIERKNIIHYQKLFIKRLRIIILIKKANKNRVKRELKDLCRICARYQYLYKAMQTYHCLRTKYVCFKKWLLYMKNLYQYESSGLNMKIARRSHFVKEFSKYLQMRDKNKENQNKLFEIKLNTLWVRWKEFTYTQKCYKALLDLFHQKHDIRLLRRLFFAWKFHLKPRYDVNPTHCYKELNIVYDLQRYKSKYLMIHHNYSQVIRKRNEDESRRLQEINEHKQTLRKLQQKQSEKIDARLKMEKRLLFSEFVDRKISNRRDEETEIFGGGWNGATISDPVMPLREKVKEIIIYTSYTVEGLQMVTTDLAQDVPLLFHGKYNSQSSTKEIFELNYNEHLIAMDISSTNLIGAVRFYTSKGRVSKWYGKGIVKPYNKVGDLEATRGRISDCTTTIIGFITRSTADDIAGLGVRMRKVVEQKVFMNCFHEINMNVSQKKQDEDDEELLTTIIRMRSCDVKAILRRAQNLAKRVKKGEGDVPEELKSLKIAFHLSEWLFNALTPGLVRAPTQQEETEGRMLVYQGKDLLEKAQERKDEAELILENIKQYVNDENEDFDMKLGLLGTRQQKQIMQIANQARDLKKQAKELEERGNALIKEGQDKMPQFNVTTKFREYFERLYRLSRTLFVLKQSGVDVNKLVEETEDQEFNLDEFEEEIRSLKIQQSALLLLHRDEGVL